MDIHDDRSIMSALHDSGLSDDDQQFWISRIRMAPKDTQTPIIEFLTTISGGAAWLRFIQEEKEQVLSASDHAAWDQIIDEEVAVLPSS